MDPESGSPLEFQGAPRTEYEIGGHPCTRSRGAARLTWKEELRLYQLLCSSPGHQAGPAG